MNGEEEKTRYTHQKLEKKRLLVYVSIKARQYAHRKEK